MNPIEPGHQFAYFGLDIVKFCKTDSGTAIDYISKYLVTQGIPNKSAHEVVQFILNEIYLRLGSPMRVITDLGMEFMADATKQLYLIAEV